MTNGTRIGEWHQWLRDDGIDFRIDRDAVQPFEWGGDAPFYGRLPLPVERTMEAWRPRIKQSN